MRNDSESRRTKHVCESEGVRVTRIRIMLTKIWLEEKESYPTISDNSMRRYYDISNHGWTDFIDFGLIRKLICGLRKKNSFKFKKYCRGDAILMK